MCQYKLRTYQYIEDLTQYLTLRIEALEKELKSQKHYKQLMMQDNTDLYKERRELKAQISELLQLVVKLQFEVAELKEAQELHITNTELL